MISGSVVQMSDYICLLGSTGKKHRMDRSFEAELSLNPAFVIQELCDSEQVSLFLKSF